MELSIILPTFNEGKNLEILIPKIFKEITKDLIKFEVIVMDDNSNDQTLNVIKNLKNEFENITFIQRSKEPSLSMSIYDGILQSKYEYVMWLDADGSMLPIAMNNLIKQQVLNPENVIIGSRFVEGGGYKGVEKDNKSLVNTLRNIYNSEDSILAVFLSRIFNNFLNFFMKTGVKDMTSGFIISKKNYLTSDDIKKCFEKSSYGEYFAFMINQLSRDKVVMQEVGYICETRLYGYSKTGTNYLQLIKRGIPYLFAAYNIRFNNEKNN